MKTFTFGKCVIIKFDKLGWSLLVLSAFLRMSSYDTDSIYINVYYVLIQTKKGRLRRKRGQAEEDDDESSVGPDK